MIELFIKPTIVLISISILTSVLPSLLQSQFVVASKALRVDFTKLDPIKGFKRIFSLRTLIGGVKSVTYVFVIVLIGWISYDATLRTLLSGINGSLEAVIALCAHVLLTTLVAVLIGCGLIAIVDYFLEYFHYTKELMMSRQEVKKESTEQNGNPEIKNKRRHLHKEILNENVKQHVRESQVLLANPTHIVIGIYFNLELSAYPFVSLVKTGESALAVLAYANEIGKPVYRDRHLVLEMYKSVKPHTFLHWSWFEPLLLVLRWMEQLEQHELTSDAADENVAPLAGDASQQAGNNQ